MAYTETIMMAFAFGIGAVGLAILFAVRWYYEKKHKKLEQETKRIIKEIEAL